MKRIKYFIFSLVIISLLIFKGNLSLGSDNQNQASLLWFEDWELPQQDYSRWRLRYPSASSNCTKSGYSQDTSVSGTYSHRSEIFCEADRSHRGYGIISFKGDEVLLPKEKAVLTGIDAPHGIVNTYWSWLDVPYSFGNKKWFSFWTATDTCSDETWGRVITLGLEDSTRKLRVAHIKNTGGTVKYDKNTPAFPLREWVRTTVYINYYDGEMHVWQNGEHLLEATFTRENNKICHFHWGAYASPQNNSITLYEDDISIWKLQRPWQDFSQEPLFTIP